MLSQFKTQVKYLGWWFSASNSKGHGMHSPFIFDFIINVLNDDREFYAFQQIENSNLINRRERKINRLLFRMVDYYQPKNIINFDYDKNGLQKEYLRATNHLISVNTINDFDDNSLKSLAKKLDSIDFIVCHSSNATNIAKCFTHSLPFTNNDSFFIVKNINDSIELKSSWLLIQNHPFVTATIDLFDLGIVLFNQNFKVKQHFKVRSRLQ